MAPGALQAATWELGWVPKQKIIAFSEQTTLSWDEKEALVRQAGGQPVRRLELINAVVAYFPAGAKGRLEAMPGVVLVADDDYAYLIAGTKGAASAEPPSKEGQQLPWGVERINAHKAWAKSQGQGIKVCIVDSGADTSHPDLAGNLAGGVSHVDPANSANYNDEIGHGTHVSGTVAALNNDTGVVGVAPKASLYQSKVFGNSGSTSWSTVVAGIEACVTSKSNVVSMSLGGSKNNEALHLAVKKAHKAGLVLVAAAGNDYGRPVSFPGAYPEVIGVTASNSQNALASFSSKGPEVDVIAPGENVLSTTMGGSYGNMSGTSMATPHVSGVVALAWSAHPGMNNDEIKSLIESTAKNIGLAPEAQGKGLADALGATQGILVASEGDETQAPSQVRLVLFSAPKNSVRTKPQTLQTRLIQTFGN